MERTQGNGNTLDLLRRVREGALSPEEALLHLKKEPFENLDYARLDGHREIRQGVQEVIYGAGKTPEQILGIASAMRDRGAKNILITRIPQEAANVVAAKMPFEYHATPRIGIAMRERAEHPIGSIVVASGGTSDIPVCEEAALTAEVLGNHVTRLYDVGVAGIHRLLANFDGLASARVVVAVAGMEGALASVIGGLVSCPVIAVPTSIGYGANFGGLSALLSMLNSCAAGVSVVNIDNGFGAGYIASKINQMEDAKR